MTSGRRTRPTRKSAKNAYGRTHGHAHRPPIDTVCIAPRAPQAREKNGAPQARENFERTIVCVLEATVAAAATAADAQPTRSSICTSTRFAIET